MISYRELKVALRALGFDVKKKDVLALLKEHDKDETCQLRPEEFEEIMTNKMLDRDPDEEAVRAFQLFDIDGTGRITLKSLRRISKQLGESIDDAELADMIDEFDTDQECELLQYQMRFVSGLLPYFL